VLSLPSVDYFCPEFTYSTLERWNTDPIAFIRENVDSIPSSARAQAIVADAESIQELKFAADIDIYASKLAEEAKTTVKEVTPHVLALLVAEASGLPWAAEIALAVVLGKLFRVLAKRNSLGSGTNGK
jgi:hypothetical protein